MEYAKGRSTASIASCRPPVCGGLLIMEQAWRPCISAVPLRPVAKKPLSPTAEDLQALPLVDEPEDRQFVLQVGTYRARMEYERNADRIFLTHVEVPPAIEGHGVAAVLTEKVLQWIEAERLKLVPYCPYVKTYLRRHTAWQRLLLKGVQI